VNERPIEMKSNEGKRQNQLIECDTRRKKCKDKAAKSQVKSRDGSAQSDHANERSMFEGRSGPKVPAIKVSAMRKVKVNR
jgi:hypothetical protein